MVSGIFSFDFSISTENIFCFDQKLMKMMPMLHIYSSTFSQIGMRLPAPSTMIIETSDNRLCELRYETIFTHIGIFSKLGGMRFSVITCFVTWLLCHYIIPFKE